MYVSGHYQPDLRILSCDMVEAWRKVVWNIDNLSSPVWRLYWMPRRHARIILDGREWKPGAEELVLIAPNSPCKTRCAEPLEQFVVHFLAAPPFDSAKPGVFVSPASDETRKLIDEIIAEEKRSTGFGMQLSLMCMELCLKALNAALKNGLSFKEDDPKISGAMKRIWAEPGKRRSVEEMAAEAGTSVNAFIRRFKAQAGATPQSYARRARVEAACIMLLRNEKSVDEIAEELGFCNRNHFTNVFTKLSGASPAKYRKIAPKLGWPGKQPS